MFPINRAAIVVRAKQPFVDWINAHPEAGDQVLTLEQVNNECHAYLVEDYANEEQLEEILRAVYLDVFFHEMWTWYTDSDESAPKSPTYQVFRDWFEVQASPMVLDLYDEPIEKEPAY